jgi:hypothetical protein
MAHTYTICHLLYMEDLQFYAGFLETTKSTDQTCGTFCNRCKNGVWPGQMSNTNTRRGKVELEDSETQGETVKPVGESDTYKDFGMILLEKKPKHTKFKQDRQRTYNVTLTHVHETTCRVKAISIMYFCVCVCVCVCVFVGVGGWARECACARVALLIQRAARRHVAICGLSSSTTFFVIISLMAQCSEKKWLNTKCVFWFSLQLLFEIFLIVRIIQRDIVINVKTSSCKVTVILVGF